MRSCLIVDDSKVVRKLERRIMEDIGFEVAEAEDGQQALDYCAGTKPELILLDWHMPVMDGITFIEKFRALPENEKTTVIFCTTETDMNNIMRAIGAGANEYVMKPFDADIIKGKLQQVGLL